MITLPYFGSKTTKNLMLNLEKLSKIFFKWFYPNQMKDNLDSG